MRGQPSCRRAPTKEEKKLLQGLEAQEVERERERKSKCSKCSHKFCGSKFTHTDPGNPNPCNSSDNWPASTSRRKCGDWSGAWCCRCDRDYMQCVSTHSLATSANGHMPWDSPAGSAQLTAEPPNLLSVETVPT